MKYYNYELAKKLIEKLAELGVLKEASMGIHEDWFWTGQTIWQNGEYQTQYSLVTNGYELIDLDKKPELGGLTGSKWGTPVLQIIYTDDTMKVFNCYTGEHTLDVVERLEIEIRDTSGVISEPLRLTRLTQILQDIELDV